MNALMAQGLNKRFQQKGRTVQALRDVSVSVGAGECVAVVGETGSGKSTLGKVVLGLLEPDSGELTINGEPWHASWGLRHNPHRLEVQPVFQNPRQSLNPRRKIGAAIAQALRARARADADVRKETVALLERVGLSPASKYVNRLPRELSGGEQQRVAIARALAVNPALIVADEPTSALDVSLRAGVLNVLRELQEQDDVALLLITHDMLVAEAMSTRMLVMKGGAVVEAGATVDVIADPQEQYTGRLLAAIPSAG